MNYNLSFQERAKLSMEQLSKQQPVTLEEAKAQVQWLKDSSISKNKKNPDININLLFDRKINIL